MTDLLERVERLEQLLGVKDGERDEAASERRAEKKRGFDDLHDWVKARKKPGNVVVFAGVGAGKGIGTAIQVFDQDKLPSDPYDLRRMAATYQALANETRLTILRELFIADEQQLTTAALMEAVGLDRGQLYHHLRDLFVEGLVEQPERGRYQLTARGGCIFLAAGVTLELGGGARQPLRTFVPEDRD